MILAAAPAAPEVPLVGWTVLGLAVLCVYVVMFGLSKGYAYSLGALLGKLADILDFKVWRFHVNLAEGIRRTDHAIQDALAAGLQGSETVVGKWWHVQAQLYRWNMDALAWFANSTVGAFDALVHGTIPDTVTTIVAPVSGGLGRLRRAVRAEVRRLEVEAVRRAHALDAEFGRDFGLAWRGIDALREDLRHRIAQALRGVESDVGALEHKVNGVIPRRLTRLEKLLGASVIGGAAIAALTRVFPYWQCSNVRRFMRGVCRSPLGSLDWLLALAALVFVTLDPEEIYEIGDDVAATFEWAWREMAGVDL